MLALKNARIIDGTGSNPIDNATVIIKGAIIDSIGTAIPESADVIDLNGRTLLPAFSDAHTHFGSTDLLARPAMGGREITYDYALNSITNLQWGVTTVRSAGDFTPDILSYRDETAEKQLYAPRILTAGRMFVAPGGHPLDTVFGSNKKIRDNACVVCDGNTDIDSEVHSLADSGVDWIKVFISTINKMNYPQPVPRLPRSTVIKITNAAHKYGIPVMIHVENPDDIQEAADIGADSIEHTIGVGNTVFDFPAPLLELLKNKGTFIVPTMSSIKAHDGMLKGAEPVFGHLEKAVKTLYDAGVKLAVGCDSGIPFLPYGECVHIEMELMAAAGIKPLEVLKIATSGNAELFRLTDRLGTIEAGKTADLVVLDADPSIDIRNTRSIKLVIKEGRIMVDRLLSGA